MTSFSTCKLSSCSHSLDEGSAHETRTGSSDYSSPNPQRGLCLAPERASDVGSTEIVKAYKAAGTMIEPISFVVPRKVRRDFPFLPFRRLLTKFHVSSRTLSNPISSLPLLPTNPRSPVPTGLVERPHLPS